MSDAPLPHDRAQDPEPAFHGASPDYPFDAACAWVNEVLTLGPYRSRGLPHRASLTALVLWVPLAVLAAIEGLLWSADPYKSFLLDMAAGTRYLIAAPLFVLAEAVYVPQMSLVARQFLEARVIAQADRDRYLAHVRATRTLLVSRWADIVILLLAFALSILTSPLVRPLGIATWIAPDPAAPTHLSMAGWWRLLVSQPLFLCLTAIWLWRLLVWTWFLSRVSRMNLRLVAAHPDHMAGLRFMTIPVRGFAILTFALGSIVAASIATSVLVDGAPLFSFARTAITHVASVVLIFGGPWLQMMPQLIKVQSRGIVEYGEAASRLGRQFEARWFDPTQRVGPEALAAPDFSATTDLYSIAANVRSVNIAVLDLWIIGALVVPTLVPYIPLLLLVVPFDQIVQVLLKLFL